MLYIDGFSLKFLITELNNELQNKKCGKIYQYDNFTIAIFFGKQNLILSINPELPIAYLTEYKENGSETPPNFCLVLRKFLQNGIISSVEQYENDRIIIFNFKAIDEIGVERKYKLILELMGKHSNLIITDSEYKIIELLKRFSIEENRLRILMPGVFYKFPNIIKKFSPYEITKEYFNSNLHSSTDIIQNIQGFGSISANECSNFELYSDFLHKPAYPRFYLKDGKISCASFFEINSFSDFTIENFATCNSLIEKYIEITINSREFNQLNKKLENVLFSEINKLEKSAKLNQKDIKKYENFERYKELGDILSANLYSIKKGEKIVKFFDFYKNEDCEIELDNEISPAENMKRFYNKFSKFKRGYNFNLERELKLLEDLEYIQSILSFLKNSVTIDDLRAVEKELISINLLKPVQTKKRIKEKRTWAISEYHFENYTIYIGKNNISNEHLTMKIADKFDLWLHAKDIPGSHVIIKGDSPFPDSVINRAAQIAAFYSKARLDSKVNIDYTEKRFVKKPTGSKPGFVTYTNQKTISASPIKD